MKIFSGPRISAPEPLFGDGEATPQPTSRDASHVLPGTALRIAEIKKKETVVTLKQALLHTERQ